MKKMMIYLNSMKSRYFMLVACVILVLGVTSCNSDDFESIAPDEQKELSNAELIEQALSRIPQTRAVAPFPIVMVTTKSTVSIGFTNMTEDVEIHWGDGEITSVPKEHFSDPTHTYSDNKPSHGISLKASNEAITNLDLFKSGLIFLEITNNTNLLTLVCDHNDLNELDLTGCPNLKLVWAGNNNLSSIDVTHLPHLSSLVLNDNQLTDIDLSKNPELENLSIGNNQITDLDLTKNTALQQISIAGLPIKTINNLPINSRSFAVYPKLEILDIFSTSFTSLDLSSNPLMRQINISGTAITQLNISNTQIKYLNARYSQLTNLIYTSNNLQHATYLKIEGTPFEKLPSNLYPLIANLPDRNLPDELGHVISGRLYTNSLTHIDPFLSLLTAKNWVVNPQ